MALTLDATLATAQDSQSRHPLVEITSSQRNADIPFDGSFLTGETFNEFGPNVIPHSTGRLCAAYCYGPDGDGDCGIKYVYTDVARTEFTEVGIELYTTTAYVMKGVSICEMTGGNIALVYLVDDTSSHVYRLLRRIITVTGTAVSNAEIANWSHDTFTSDPWVTTLTTNSYLLVYGKKSGSDYFIYKRTSSDCVTWSAESALSIADLTSTWRLSNPSIVKISTGDLWLFFDALESTGPGGEELTNIYYSISADSGATWGAAVKLTAYTTYSEVGSHPVAVQKVANTLHLIFTRKVGALHMTDTATGWPAGNNAYELSWDSVNRKLYVINDDGGPSVVRIDVDTWTADKYWDKTTTPAFPSFADSYQQNQMQVQHDGPYIAIFSSGIQASDGQWILYLDAEADTITNIYIYTVAGYGITSNVTGWPSGFWNIRHIHVDHAASRLYLFMNGESNNTSVRFGYFDMTETGGTYAYHSLCYDSARFTSGEVQYITGASTSGYGGNVLFDVENDYVIFCSCGYDYGGWHGTLAVYALSSGAYIKRWSYGEGDTDFPVWGVLGIGYYNGKVYASIFQYSSGYGQSGYRGLMEIDINSEVIKYHRPSYCTDNNHQFGPMTSLGDGRLAFHHIGYGIAIYNTVDDTWEIYGNSNIAGFTARGTNPTRPSQVVYDSTNELLMIGDYGYGVIMFSTYGYLRQAYYIVGTNSGSWTFGTAAALCQGYLDYNAGACAEPGSTSSMYVFWINESVTAEKSIKWDKDGSTIDISGYITQEVSTEHTISGQPAKLAFSVSHGHLFDPYNTSSLLSPVLKKGRKLDLRWGEKISGTDYWQNAGTFFVTETSIEFRRGTYPEMKVSAEDQRCLWTHGHVYATPIYNNLPEYIIQDLLEDLANIATVDIDLPSFAGATNLQMQWIETTLDEILTQICERHGYYFRFDVDGKASARQISNTAAIDHTYTNNAKLIKYTPDDKYSDFTNRVTVRGQELDFTEVQFNEERITTLNGTIGWWGCRKDHQVYFSDDKSRRCVYPRLEVIETATSISMQLAGGVSEWLEECGALDDDKFCMVYVDAPNLIPELIAGLALYAGGALIGDAVLSFFAGYTFPIGRTIEAAGMLICVNVLGSVANYQYAIWARPLGNIRRSVQGTANDLEHQTDINAVVEQVIDDPLCYSVADCTAVATFELMVAQMQRKRVVIEKIAHLQDEDGDTIRVVHPYSGKNLDLYIADIRRRFKKSDPGKQDGYFLDEIEGWVVT